MPPAMIDPVPTVQRYRGERSTLSYRGAQGKRGGKGGVGRRGGGMVYHPTVGITIF